MDYNSLFTVKQTYCGNKIYDDDFTSWFNNWIEEKTYNDYEYGFESWHVSDEQKEELFLAYKYHDESIMENISQDVEVKIYLKNKDFPNWLKEFRRKNNFAENLIGGSSSDMLFEAYFKDDDNMIQQITEQIKKFKEHSINELKEEKIKELDFEELEEEKIKELDFEERNNEDNNWLQKDMNAIIKNWFELQVFSPKDLTQIIDLANKRLVTALK